MRHGRLFMLAALALLAGNALAQGPNNTGTYYAAANGKSGAELKSALYGIIGSPRVVGYSGLNEKYKLTDKRADGYLRDWYSNATSYTWSDTSGNASEGAGWNKEHTVPQSWFSEAAPMKSDIVHVVPTDAYVNNLRGSYPFAEVSSVARSSKNQYSKVGSCSVTGYSGTVFEPSDDIKGDIARIYFYMVTCYENRFTGWNKGESGKVFASTTYPGLQPWVLDMLMRWAKQDPIDDVELARNAAVYQVQQNRNPFVDYPGLEDYIWGDRQEQAFSYDNYGGDVTTYVAMPTFTPESGTYYNKVEVTISCATEGADIYYTTDGADASELSIPYEGPFTVTETSTIKAVAVKADGQSRQATASYTITDTDPAEGLIALNNTFFNCSYNGAMSNATEDLTGTAGQLTVVYALGSGSNRYCNADHIRLYQGNTLTVSTSQGSLTAVELETKNTGKTLLATTGTVSGYTWAGNAPSVTFSVNSGSGNLQVSGIRVTTVGSTAVDLVQAGEPALSGHRVVYNLRGQRVDHPTRGIYIVDGKKVVIQ